MMNKSHCNKLKHLISLSYGFLNLMEAYNLFKYRILYLFTIYFLSQLATAMMIDLNLECIYSPASPDFGWLVLQLKFSLGFKKRHTLIFSLFRCFLAVRMKMITPELFLEIKQEVSYS